MAPFAVSSLLGVAVPEGAAVLLPLALVPPVPRDTCSIGGVEFDLLLLVLHHKLCSQDTRTLPVVMG